MTELLVAEALAVGHRGTLLANVDLAFGAGEGWFVLGRNGSGKTTLVHALIGLRPVLAGRVAFAPVLADRRRLGFVAQEAQFDHGLPCTVAEFVALGLPDREPRAAATAATWEALRALGIADLARRPVSRLSGGQRRRALVARALARRPALLVLDEPTAGLDEPTTRRFAADLDALRLEHGLATVHVTHDLSLAARHATHLALVHEGTVTAGAAGPLLAGTRLAEALGTPTAEPT